jgi:hypothetical protein
MPPPQRASPCPQLRHPAPGRNRPYRAASPFHSSLPAALASSCREASASTPTKRPGSPLDGSERGGAVRISKLSRPDPHYGNVSVSAAAMSRIMPQPLRLLHQRNARLLCFGLPVPSLPGTCVPPVPARGSRLCSEVNVVNIALRFDHLTDRPSAPRLPALGSPAISQCSQRRPALCANPRRCQLRQLLPSPEPAGLGPPAAMGRIQCPFAHCKQPRHVRHLRRRENADLA